jgi:hypothetical protein
MLGITCLQYLKSIPERNSYWPQHDFEVRAIHFRESCDIFPKLPPLLVAQPNHLRTDGQQQPETNGAGSGAFSFFRYPDNLPVS